MSKYKCSLLVVDDEPYILPTLSALLAGDFEVITADCGETAQQIVAQRKIDLILTDQKMPRMAGVELLEWVRQRSPKTVRLLMTGYAELEDAVEAINRGQVYYYLLKPWRTEELLQILRNAAEKFLLERNQENLLSQLQQLNFDLERRVTDRTRELEQALRRLEETFHMLEETNRKLDQRNGVLEKLAKTDPLTGLLNRRAIEDVACFELKRRSRYHSPLAIGMIDADHFKRINECYFHPGGDQALIGLAQILTNLLRDVDTVGRVGGEEFLVVAPETNLEGACALAERIRSTVESTPVRYLDKLIPLTVSIGFSVAEVGTAPDYKQMYNLTAAALNAAKTAGRNCAVVRSLRQQDDAA